MFLLFIYKCIPKSGNNKFNDKKPINENEYCVLFNERIILGRPKCYSRGNIKKSTENYIWVSKLNIGKNYETHIALNLF